MSFLFDDTSGYQYNMADLPVPNGINLENYLPYISKYNPETRAKTTRIHADCFLAIDAYAKSSIGQPAPFSLGKEDNQIFVEYYTIDKIYLVVYQQSNGMFLTGLKLFGNNTIKTLKVNEASAAVPLFLAILDEAKQDIEFELHFKRYCDYLSNIEVSKINIEETIAVMVDNVYQRIENKKEIKVEAHKKMTPAFLKNTALTTIMFGDFKVFKVKESKKHIVIEELKKQFNRNRRLSDDEKCMMPNIQEYIVVPDNIPDICNMIKEIKHSALVQNLFIYGEPGAGKSTIARMIAYIFGLPYVFLSCKPEMETIDLESTILPNVGGKIEYSNLPTYDDFMYDPALAVYKLTQKYNPTISQKEAWDEIVKACTDRSDFISVPSPIVQAAKYGYVVEIQERATR